ncbi:MAG: TraB/GumN family protein [Desulfobulbaceae bacterium]|uniref:TraB/GumN family protein n=1 Tax=Candidatus Desulfobia pelagia TaxID=2841692 RepID=A0A8J6TBT3_9BACT|nr:TraB/GumN family protein [Candidatus Desulfobia pelagia]
MTQPSHMDAADVHSMNIQGRECILIGTAHISKESVNLVRQVIEQEKPDCVCVELDHRRYRALSDTKRWQSLDLKKIIRTKQLSTLLMNLILASYQKKLGDQLGVMPGSELLEAAKTAENMDIPVELCDRDVRVTMRRAWKATSFFRKSYLVASLIASLFEETEITEEKLKELKETDVLSELMAELGQALPELKQVLIDERDTYLAEKIKATEGQKIVAVVGAGHIEGIKKALQEDRSDQMEEINTIPPVSPTWKAVGWLIPLVIIGSLCLVGFLKGSDVAGDNLIYWILANGIPSSIGALIALAHPYTILSAFVAAPITSLTPVIGAGYVCAFIQAMAQPPVVREFETVLEDMSKVSRWWQNRLLKVFLAFILPGFGSMIGTWIGGYEIISTLISP